MKINEIISNLVIETKPEYSDELNEFINSHNTVVASFVQNTTLSSILSILYKKNIITDEEFDVEITRCVDMSKQKEILEKNRDGILECIASEESLHENLVDMYESLEEKYSDCDENAFNEKDCE